MKNCEDTYTIKKQRPEEQDNNEKRKSRNSLKIYGYPVFIFLLLLRLFFPTCARLCLVFSVFSFFIFWACFGFHKNTWNFVEFGGAFAQCARTGTWQTIAKGHAFARGCEVW